MATFKKLLKQIIDDNKELKTRISPLNVEKAQKYDKISADIRNISLSVESVKTRMNEQGLMEVVVKYTPIVKVLKPTADGIIGDEMFKSINALDLIPYKDMEKIQKAITEANTLNDFSKK